MQRVCVWFRRTVRRVLMRKTLKGLHYGVGDVIAERRRLRAHCDTCANCQMWVKYFGQDPDGPRSP